MKYNFWGYDTKVMTELGLDFNDLAFIQWFRDFKDTGEMEQIETPEGVAYYVNYDKVASDIPVLFKTPTGTETTEELNKILNANRTKVARMIKGNLSKVFTRYEKKVDGRTKIYLLLNAIIYTSLINNGRNFDGAKINTDNAVVKVGKDVLSTTKTKKINKKAPSTVPPVKDAKQKTDNNLKHDTDSIPETTPEVKENMVGEIDIDTLNINALAIYDAGIEIKNVEAVNNEVATWSGLVLSDAITITLTTANKPNYVYLRKTYYSLVKDGVEKAEEKELEKTFTFTTKYTR